MTELTGPAATLVVLWTRPDDTGPFDAEYNGPHLALARKIPGLRELRVSTLRSPTHYRMAELCFGNLDGLRSEENRAVSEDAEQSAWAHGVRSDSHVALLGRYCRERTGDHVKDRGAVPTICSKQ